MGPMRCSILTTISFWCVGAQDLFLSRSVKPSVDSSSKDVGATRPLDSGTVLTISPASNPMLCLDFSQGHGQTLIQMWECNGHENQLFYFDAGSYRINLGSDRSTCIDAGSGMTPGTKLYTWSCNGLSQQKWGYDFTAQTIFLQDSMTNAAFCMDLAGGKVEAGTVLQLWNCNNQPQQKFNLLHGINLRVLADWSYCLDVAGGKMDNGSPIQLWKCNGHINQKWMFENFQIRSIADSTKCIDAGDMQPSTHYQIWDCNNLPQQQFGYDQQMNTIYLSNSATDSAEQLNNSTELGAGVGASACMDIYGGEVKEGTPIDNWECNACWNQQFEVIGPSSNSLNKVVDVVGGRRSIESTNSHVRMRSGAGCPQKPSPSPTPGPPAPPTPHPGAAGILPHCGAGYASNWPSFSNQQALAASPWGKYFKLVYGEIPTTGYPICTDSLQFLYSPLLSQAGVKMPMNAQEICPKKGGTLYTDPRWFQMSFALWIYNPKLEHPQSRGSGLPSNTWVEVLHNAFSMDGAATWFYYAPGTAVYMNTGNTRVWTDHDGATKSLLNQACKGGGHNECVSQFPALYAAGKKAGLASLQFTAHADMQCGKGGSGLLALEIVDLGGPGTTTCSQTNSGPTRFKSGWEAKSVCTCSNSKKTINCQGFGISR